MSFTRDTRTVENSRAIRGHIVTFKADPFFTDDFLVEYSDGLVIIKDGKVSEVGDYQALKGKIGDLKVDSYPDKIISAGFVDSHIHYSQTEIIAAFGKHLIDWLNDYTFPCEMQFKENEHANEVASIFCDELLRNGTTTSMTFTATYPESVDAIFEAAHQRNMRIIAGKVLMDRNAPEGLLDTAETAYSDSKALAEKWHGTGRLHYAVTPRFAPTSTPAELEAAGQLLKDDPSLWMHTHLAEQIPECHWVAQLFPKARNYLDVYDKAGLVRERSMFAHCIHLDMQERILMSERGAAAAHCPTSNLFLGSGLFPMDIAKNPKHPTRVGLGTDIGAGTQFSQLSTMGEAYKVSNLLSMANGKRTPINGMHLFFLATLGGAEAMYLDDKIGSIAAGKEADIIVLDPEATDLLKFRSSRCTDTEEQLFVLATMGDETTVAATYINGALAYERDQ